jgi:thiol-disulfide isomerase/thioredoxin
MRKYLLIIFAICLLAVALYTVNTYNSTKASGNNSSKNSNKRTEGQNISSTPGTTENDTTISPTSGAKLNDTAASPTPVPVENNTVTLEKTEDFTLVDIDGNEVSLSDFMGKKVFLNFWATWCPPCKAEMPEIEKIYQETKDSDLVILSVEIGESNDTVKEFLADKDYNFKVLLDLDQSVATTYGISAIPTSFFIDEEGNIISKRVGGMSYDEMNEYIEALDK